jgi:hypothetical protein
MDYYPGGKRTFMGMLVSLFKHGDNSRIDDYHLVRQTVRVPCVACNTMTPFIEEKTGLYICSADCVETVNHSLSNILSV